MLFLRYIGGKYRGRKAILNLIPKDVQSVCSPFLGGGAIELSLAKKGVQVFGYDKFEPLVNCWQQIKRDPHAVADAAAQFFPMTKDRFYELRESYWSIADPILQAGAFFAINRASFGGLTFSGGYSGPDNRFTASSIAKLRSVTLSNVTINHADFEDSLGQHPDAFVYADPPYLFPQEKATLYGVRGNLHRDFDHQRLAAVLRGRTGRWLLSYNNAEEVRTLYEGFPMIATSWAYGTGENKTGSELLIMSHELAESLGLTLIDRTKTVLTQIMKEVA